jgi:hypothetical protein
MSQEPIFKLNYKTFLRSPFSYIFFIAITAIIYLGRVIISNKEAEIEIQQKRIDDCDEERRADKKLLQDIVFQKEIKDKIDGE